MIPAVRGRRRRVPRRDDNAIVVLVRGDAELASWPLPGRGRPDLGAVEALARLQLAARRLGCSIRLRDACVELSELLELCGLSEVVGEPEGGEQLRVEEIVMPDDPVA